MPINEAVDWGIEIDGFPELKAKLVGLDKQVSADLRRAIGEIAKPMTVVAHNMAVTNISHLDKSPNWTIDWGLMRIGVSKHAVYMVPKQRGVSSRQSRAQRRGRYSKMSGMQLASFARQRFAPILLEKAMEPASVMMEPVIRAELRTMELEIERQWGH